MVAKSNIGMIIVFFILFKLGIIVQSKITNKFYNKLKRYKQVNYNLFKRNKKGKKLSN
jgi:hypothetical protein